MSEVAKKIVMNIAPTMLCANLVTKDVKGRPESLIMTPRSQRELTLEQFSSPEVQKFISAKLWVDVSASVERRKVAEGAAKAMLNKTGRK